MKTIEEIIKNVLENDQSDLNDIFEKIKNINKDREEILKRMIENDNSSTEDLYIRGLDI